MQNQWDITIYPKDISEDLAQILRFFMGINNLSFSCQLDSLREPQKKIIEDQLTGLGGRKERKLLFVGYGEAKRNSKGGYWRTVFLYNYNELAMSTISHFSDFIDDLSFYKGDKLLFHMVKHEKVSWLTLNKFHYDRLVRDCPDVPFSFVPDGFWTLVLPMSIPIFISVYNDSLLSKFPS